MVRLMYEPQTPRPADYLKDFSLKCTFPEWPVIYERRQKRSGSALFAKENFYIIVVEVKNVYKYHNDRDTPVAKHFNLIDHNIQHLNIIAIDHLPHSDTISRLNKETFWIQTLKTTEPQGLNMDEQSSFPIHLRQSL
ncbi:hypothetical protein PoB_007615700 [Plakobranchus ocellatus]|uniref:Uncharacterized protein n=1 Tax=Plakobranchus ocellatus TaxID=259542 RepID=A0AAV4DZ74_9GAST|nr:hypothetical protein PoB_007615700 [Plakobranchus ocellatus]